jgi:hypothetical protein
MYVSPGRHCGVLEANVPASAPSRVRRRYWKSMPLHSGAGMDGVQRRRRRRERSCPSRSYRWPLTNRTPDLSPLQRIDVRRWVADRDVDDNVDDLGHIVLIFAIARYETWIDEVLELQAGEIAAEVRKQFPRASHAKVDKERQELRRALAAAFQFCSRPRLPVQSAAAADQLLRCSSPRLASALSRIAQTGPRVMTESEMENALRLYRMYKEIRNGLVHGGAIASDRAERACHGAAALPRLPRQI